MIPDWIEIKCCLELVLKLKIIQMEELYNIIFKYRKHNFVLEMLIFDVSSKLIKRNN